MFKHIVLLVFSIIFFVQCEKKCVEPEKVNIVPLSTDGHSSKDNKGEILIKLNQSQSCNGQSTLEFACNFQQNGKVIDQDIKFYYHYRDNDRTANSIKDYLQKNPNYTNGTVLLDCTKKEYYRVDSTSIFFIKYETKILSFFYNTNVEGSSEAFGVSSSQSL